MSFSEKEATFETLNTHTYYYLAQVYEKMGEPSKSAKCCHVTLTKQLELKAFQPLDWATNAAMLSQHYLAKEDYSSTKRHLIAACVMLERYQILITLNLAVLCKCYFSLKFGYFWKKNLGFLD